MECFQSIEAHYSCVILKFFEIWQRRAGFMPCLRTQVTFVGAVPRPTFIPTSSFLAAPILVNFGRPSILLCQCATSLRAGDSAQRVLQRLVGLL